MKQTILFVLTVFLLGSCTTTKLINSENELSKQMSIDNLVQEIYRDTVKFNGSRFVFSQIGRRNLDSYSMLYVVNGRYQYLLDIISSDKVVEFVNEFLNSDKIDNIVIMPKEKATAFGGSNAKNGVVFITMKKKVKFNPFVAEFKKTRKNSGNNFFDRKPNEIMINI